jgi:hypothetical protein
MRIRLVAAFLLVIAWNTAAMSQPPAALDSIAREYVRISLEAGEREPEYVDAYYGPPEWALAAKQHTRSIAALQAAAAQAKARALAIDPRTLDRLARGRRAFLIGQLTAAEARLAMHAGKRLDFDDEALQLFGVKFVPTPLEHYDPTLAGIDRLVPGAGPLWERVDAFRNRFTIPADRLAAVMRASIAECRRRTVAFIPLPPGENFSLELVSGKPWGGYNYYKGSATSLIQVNTDLPVLIDRALDLGCHEGYPGHHVYNLLLEKHLARELGWVEFTIYPLYGPQSLLAEGSANYGIELAFPGDERAAFEAQVLYPLAGLDPAEAARFSELANALQALAGARFTIAREYLDGRIDREAAIALLQKYQLLSVERARKSLEFADHYRSYVINYGLGMDMVKAHVEGVGTDPAARWREMARILSEPTTPADLLQGH